MINDVKHGISHPQILPPAILKNTEFRTTSWNMIRYVKGTYWINKASEVYYDEQNLKKPEPKLIQLSKQIDHNKFKQARLALIKKNTH